MIVLLTTLMLPYVLGRLRRRWAYTLGVVGLIAASLFFASFTVPGQIAGMFFRNCGAGILNITLSLYIMDHIKKSDLAHSEPLRLSLSTFSWMIGPASGVWLYTQFGPWGPQLVSIAVAVALLVLFWVLRLSDRVTLPSGNLQRFNPLANVMRFVRQPRLRLAWMVAFGRSCFWVTFFVYGPLLMVESGVGEQTGGLMISASQALLLFAYVFGRLARKFGVRAIISLCFQMMALAVNRRRDRRKGTPLYRHVLSALWRLRGVRTGWGRRHSLFAGGAHPRTPAHGRRLPNLHRFLRSHSGDDFRRGAFLF